MERNVFDILEERGFIEQTSHEDEIKDLLGKESVTFYCGYDPTADSLTAGHFLTLMAISHMQKAGHRPIILIGGGTTMVGDPTGKTDMRKMLTLNDINTNAEKFKNQMERFIDFDDDKAIMSNNADWLLNLEYLPFLREIGAHFSVNRMLSAECYKSRMESGLTFLEFNYMIMQSYDFLELNRKYNCKLQIGGNDQWSNMLGGIDLIRKKESKSAYVLTFTLLTTPDGKKMGKTEEGALWLDPNKTSPYDFYQYWRNVDDSVVERCLSLLTFLPMDEVKRLGGLEGAKINKAKEILAYEVTKIVHGQEEANKAQNAAQALFSSGGNNDSIPSVQLDTTFVQEGIGILNLLTEVELTSSNGEGRRLVKQGGVYVNEERVSDIKREITLDDFQEGKLMIRKGKKIHLQVTLK